METNESNCILNEYYNLAEGRKEKEWKGKEKEKEKEKEKIQVN